ncbi:MAG: ribosome biogenesis GTP-binding protein YihA/YsxC [Bacteroidota bacterium]|nr:ribosome biogenesis GTP-binding protein YihA/YsxC [Bacteroidota bacterium]
MIHSAQFVQSSPSLRACPKDGLPEFAFIGRSNVGKSSLINMLTDRKGLAKVSGTPGKTQLINHFRVNDSWFLVDLPGYGYAKISQKERVKIQTMIEDYLLKRETLQMIFLLIDSRHKPQKTDLGFIAGLTKYKIPFTILFTKTDKLTGMELSRNLRIYREVLSKYFPLLPVFIITSSKTGKGKEEILSIIGEAVN